MKKFIGLCLVILFCQRGEQQVEVHFSPNGGALKALVSHIDQSKKEIKVAMYAFTSRELAQALVGAHERGVKVSVVLDGEFSGDPFSKGEFLVKSGIEVRSDQFHLRATGEPEGKMHNKFAIIDNAVLATGSYNWTASAEKLNDENLLLFKNAPDLIKRYRQKFNELYNRSTPFNEVVAGAPPEPKLLVMANDLENLRRHAGERAIVKGKVFRASKSKRSDTYFLDFGPDREAFTAVIFSSAAADFFKSGIDPLKLTGKNVALIGEIKNHPKYGLEIILDSAKQLKIVEE
jgi:phosphatidylserine/phosphatidylglycerophosphate/cardiolipin synthase-like enzyme